MAGEDSVLVRLFNYAKTAKTEAVENFTTEALRAAILDEPRPFLAVLEAVGLISVADGTTVVGVESQVWVSGTGFIDLVLRLSDRAGHTTEIWIEVKVASPESGQQIENYLRYIAAQPAETRARLAVLGPKPLRDENEVPWIPWQLVWRTLEGEREHGRWNEFRHWLEARWMADQFDEPISALEVDSLAASFRLRGKANRILEGLARQFLRDYPTLGWPTSPGVVRDRVTYQFNKHQRLMIDSNTAFMAKVLVGFGEADNTGNRLCVWVENEPKSFSVRSRLLQAANDGALPAEWERRQTTWQALVFERRLSAGETHEQITEWFRSRVGELQTAGIVDLIPALGLAAPDVSAAVLSTGGPGPDEPGES
jgi:hypothetical protein